MANVFTHAVLSTLDSAKAAASAPLEDDAIASCVQDVLFLISTACIDNCDEAMLSMILSSQDNLLKELKGIQTKSSLDTVIEKAYTNFARTSLKPDPWKEPPPYWFIQKISSSLTQIRDPFSFVFNFDLRNTSLGNSYEHGQLIEDVLDRDFAKFTDPDVASMLMCGAKIYGKHDRSFLSWKAIDDPIRFNPIIAACNRLNIRRSFGSFYLEDQNNAAGDWAELANFDEQRARYYDGSNFLKACELFTGKFIMKGALLITKSPHAFRDTPLHFVAKELAKGKPMQSYVNYRSDFSSYKTVASLSSKIESVNVALALQDENNSDPKVAALGLIRSTANSAQYHADCHAQLTTICRNYLSNPAPDIIAMVEEAHRINGIMMATSPYIETSAFEMFDNSVIAEFMAKADKMCQQYNVETDSGLLYTFFKRWGIGAINHAIDHMDESRFPVALSAITSLKRTDNVFFVSENAKMAGEALGKMELRSPKSTASADVDDIALRCAAHLPTLTGRLSQVFNSPKKSMISDFAPSVPSVSDELNSFISRIPVI